MSYDLRHLRSPDAFEILVYLVLCAENPESTLQHLKPPDRGIDILRRGPDGITAYQCKHYSRPTLSQIRREIEASLYRACQFRTTSGWGRIEFCFSSNLTAPQYEAIGALAKKFNLNRTEWSIRSGSQFTPTLMKNPKLWDEAVSASASTDRLKYATAGRLEVAIDQRLAKVLRDGRLSGSQIYLPDTFSDFGIDRFQNLSDWYLVASRYFGTTKTSLRVFSLDEEISMFWLTERGNKYFEMNKMLIGRGVLLRRLYIFDFDKLVQQPANFITFLRYCATQDELGVTNRIVPLHLFQEIVSYDCKLFAVQDDTNVIFYSQDFEVIFNRQRSTIDDAKLLFDELYEHKEAVTPAALLKRLGP